MPAAEIIPLNLGRVTQVERSGQQYLTGYGEKIDAQMIAWLIRTPRRIILFDAGPGPPRLVKDLVGRELVQTDNETLESALHQHGLNQGDIDTLVLSHLHWDHSMGILVGDWTSMEILVQRAELQYAAAPFSSHMAAFSPEVTSLLIENLFSGSSNVRVMDGDFELDSSVSIIHTPGHTPGLQCAIVRGKQQRYVIASDNVPLLSSIQSVPPSGWTPPGIHVSLDAWTASITRLVRPGDVVLPSHDPEVLRNPMYG